MHATFGLKEKNKEPNSPDPASRLLKCFTQLDCYEGCEQPGGNVGEGIHQTVLVSNALNKLSEGRNQQQMSITHNIQEDGNMDGLQAQ